MKNKYPNLNNIEIAKKVKIDSYKLVENLGNKSYNIRENISKYAFENSSRNPEEVFSESLVVGIYGNDKKLLEMLKGD